MVVLSGRIEDPTIQHSVTKGAHPKGRWAWRVTWIVIVVLMIGAGIYGYLRFAEYGRAKVVALIQEGQQNEAKLEFGAALSAYTQAQALGSVAPDGAAQAAYRAAALYERKSNHLEAQRVLRDAEKLDSSVPEYPIALGRSLLMTRAIDEAEQAFDRALAIDDASPVASGALVGKARVALARQQRDQAGSAINDALTKDPTHDEAMLVKAVLLIHDEPGDSQEMLMEVKKSDNKGFAATASSLEDIADQLQAELNNATYERVLVGAALIEHNELDLALMELMDATEQDDNYRDAWVNRAQTEVLLGKLDEAQRSIDKALEIDPTFGFSRYVVGQIAEKRGNLEDAKKAYELAIEQRYREPQVYIALAGVLEEQSRQANANLDPFAALKQVRELLQGALDDGVQSHELFDTLFWHYLEADLPKDALKTAEAYAAFDTRGTTAQGLLAYAQLIDLQDERARKTANDLVVRDPLSAIGAYVLGVLDEDHALFQKALDLDVGGRIAEMAKAALVEGVTGE